MNLKLITLFLVFSFCFSKNVHADSLLYIGDSQTAGFLGQMVFDKVSSVLKPEDIRVYGVSSSSPRHWAGSPNSKSGAWLCRQKGRINDQRGTKLRSRICNNTDQNLPIFTHINSLKPKYVVFQFLGNSVNFDKAFVQRKVTSLLRNLDNQKCLFITSPPHYFEREKSNKARVLTENYIAEAVGSRCLFSKGMTKENLEVFSKNRSFYARDKIHLTRAGATEFMSQIESSLDELLKQ